MRSFPLLQGTTWIKHYSSIYYWTMRKRETMKTVNDMIEGLKICFWDISWNLLTLFLNSHQQVQWGHLGKMNENQMNHNRGHGSISQMKANYSPPEHAGFLASAVADLLLDTCTAGNHCTIVAAMAPCYGTMLWHRAMAMVIGSTVLTPNYRVNQHFPTEIQYRNISYLLLSCSLI